MNPIDIPIETINNYLSENPFDFNIQTEPLDNFTFKVKVQITGIKEYIRIGLPTEYVEYTLYILPNPKTDYWASIYGQLYGHDIPITTTSREYSDIRRKTSHYLDNLLTYFGVDYPSICTRVINEVKKPQVNESLLTEDKYDGVVRDIVRDIITIFKKHGEGEYGLPEDLRPKEVYYNFPQLQNDLQVYVDMSFDESVEGFEADADYYNDEDLIYITLVTNPKFGNTYFYDLVGELNELVRHELEHVRQHEKGYDFPKREPKKPLSYYSQEHELDAQKAGFRRRKKIGGLDYETVVRNWFEENKHKHRLNKQQQELVIQKLLKEK